MKATTITPAQLIELQNCLQRIHDILGVSTPISDAHTTMHPSSTRSRKRPTQRVTNATFTYRWLTNAPQRITTLYQYLLRAKWIAHDANPDDFCAIFEGNPSTARIKWIGKQAFLYYLIRQLVDLQLVSIPQNASVWQIVESHFLDKNSRPFHNFNKQKEPIKAKAAIDKLIEILQPSA